MYWRQRAPFRSRTRDRQSSYNPQLCSACAPRTVVRRYLGSRPSTRARTRGACSPAPPGGDTAFLSEIGEITLIAHHSRLPPSPAAAVSGPSLRYIETSRPATVSHARRRAYPPCHSMHDHRWGQRCSCDCGFGLTSRPLACSCTPHGAVLEPPGGLGRSLAVCHCWEWQARSGASEHAFGRRECQKQRGIARLLPCVGRGVCRDFMVRKCSEEVIRGGPALLSVGTDIPERAGARGRFCI